MQIFLVAIDSFKGTISAKRACAIIKKTILSKISGAKVITKPIADGGEGTAEAISDCLNGEFVPVTVMGPLENMQIQSGFVWIEAKKIAIVEMAMASGITLLPSEELNPLKATTYGTGELIKAVMKYEPKAIYLAVGGSATNDVGIGAAMALGWQFQDEFGNSIGLGGQEIEKIETIIPPAEKIECKIKVLSDVTSPLCGELGATRTFGPQKGADPQMVERLESSITRFSKLVKQQLGKDVAEIPGSGAAGGLSAGAVAFMDAEIVSGINTIISLTGIEQEIREADWIITGEGKFDRQSLNGKVISGIAHLTKQANKKLAVIAGCVELQMDEYKPHGIDIAISCKKDDMSLDYALSHSEQLLEKATEEFIELMLKTQY